MKSFYQVLDNIKEIVNAEPFSNQITFGDISEIDLKKQSLFPLTHLMINTTNINENTVSFNVTFFFMDLVDISNTQTTDYYRGNDNLHDILNTQLALATRVLRVLQKGDLYRDKFQVDESASCEPFLERFDNTLAGWAVTVSIETKDNMTYC